MEAFPSLLLWPLLGRLVLANTTLLCFAPAACRCFKSAAYVSIKSQNDPVFVRSHGVVAQRSATMLSDVKSGCCANTR